MYKRSARLRLHIGIFGKRNAGKSSLFNRLARHEAAIVSPEPGTTTDPVRKSMEHHFLGPLLLIDTAGLDDRGEMGGLRVQRAREVLDTVDLAVLTVEPGKWDHYEDELVKLLQEKKVPCIIAITKVDLAPPAPDEMETLKTKSPGLVSVSAKTGQGVEQLMDALRDSLPSYWREARPLARDLLNKKEIMGLVTAPDDTLAQGRLSIAHNRLIREALDRDAQCAVIPADRLEKFMKRLLAKPGFFAADFPVCLDTRKILGGEIPVTTVSILFARFNGDLETYTNAAYILDELAHGAKILVVNLEKHLPGGLVKDLLGEIEAVKSKNLEIDVVKPGQVPDSTGDFSMAVLVNEERITSKKSMDNVRMLKESGLPVTNLDIMLAVNHREYRFLLDIFTPENLEET